jgi:hypothetical protein
LLLDEWNTAVNEKTSEEWITFRPKFFELGYFLKMWKGRTKNAHQTEVRTFVITRIKDIYA